MDRLRRRGPVLARGVDAAIRSDNSAQLGMDRHDFDRDGRASPRVTLLVAR